MKSPDRRRAVRTVAIIPSAGSGVRMGSDRPKQFLDLNGRPLLAVTLNAFEGCRAIDSIVLVVPPSSIDTCRKEIVERFDLKKVLKVVPGGDRRQDSVRRGLEAAGEGFDLALIHDGARPLVDEPLIERMVAAGLEHPAAIASLSAVDTVKEVDEGGRVVKTLDRKKIRLIQTPQVFRFDLLYEAHRRAKEEGWGEATDDSLLMERLGIPVRAVEGSAVNLKVTTPNDLQLARLLLGGRLKSEAPKECPLR